LFLCHLGIGSIALHTILHFNNILWSCFVGMF
jgi:hypothetical protein